MPVSRNTTDFRIRSFGKTEFQEWVGKKQALMVVPSSYISSNTLDFRIRHFEKTGFQEWVGKKLAPMQQSRL